MKVIVVDDELDILHDISACIAAYEGVEVIGAFANPFSVLAEVHKLQPDCIFLDIEMPGINGIDLAEKLITIQPNIDIVFLTAFNHYATQAFEVNAIDYILKPIHPKRFEKSMQRLLNNMNKPPSPKSITLRSFGYFEVLIDNRPVKWQRSKAKELLAYLLHFLDQKKSKYKICEDLWPEYAPKAALVNLQTAMYSLRKSLGLAMQKSIYIEFSDESYVLMLKQVNWDAQEFQTLYHIAKKGDIASAKDAVLLYRGDYMENEDWPWAQLATESIAGQYGELLQMIAEQCFLSGEFQEAADSIMSLAKRQALDKSVQLMLVEALYKLKGVFGLKQLFTLFRTMYRKEHDMDLDNEVLEYYFQKII